MINLTKGLKLKSILVFVGLGLGLIFLLGLLFSKTVQIFALPVIIFSVALYFLYSNNKSKSFKQGFVINYIMIVLMLLSAGFLIYNSTVQASYENVELIGGFEYASIGCLPASGGEVFSEPIYAGYDGEVTIFAPENSINYDLTVSYPDLDLLSYQYSMRYSECDENGENCGQEFRANFNFDFDDLPDSKYRLASGISSSRSFKIAFEKRLTFVGAWQPDTSNRGFLELESQPYILWRVDTRNSGTTVLNDEGCEMPYGEDIFQGIISSNSPMYDEFSPITGLEPNQFYNYITAISPVFVDGDIIGDYKGETGYCVAGGSSAIVYGVWEVVTKNQGAYKIVDASNILGYEECCPTVNYGTLQQCVDYKLENIEYTAVLDEDGNLVSGTTNIFCSGLYPLPTGEQIFKSKITHEWECRDGVGVMVNFKEVECTFSSDCKDTEICSNFKCVLGGTTSTLEDKIIAENEGTCAWYEDYSAITEKTWLLGVEKPTGEYECQPKPEYIFLAIFLGLIILVIVGVLVNPNKPVKAEKPKTITKTIYYRPRKAKAKSKPKKRK